MTSTRTQVKNRAPAPIQITAEQLLRESKERGLEDVAKAPKQFITDKEELLEYQQSRRKDFENQIRRQRNHIGTWCKYALWEASLKEFDRARSVFERALDVDYRNPTLWFKYVEMEMKNKFLNHARNILDRCVALHPRVDKFWFKYTYVEEMVGAVEQARQVFERWMKWEPDDLAWAAYIKFEMRQGEIGRARGIYERYVACHPTSRAYLKYAKWEEVQGQKALARSIYERSLNEIHHDEGTEKLLINFARFEERCKEFERARVVYRYTIDQLGRGQGSAREGDSEGLEELKKEFIAFEKRHGGREEIESAILRHRREVYELAVSRDAFDYDAWFDFCRLEETEGTVETTRSTYQRAVGNVPPIAEKRFWRRYIYLFIYHAVFEELTAHDIDEARAVYKRALSVIPHKEFTFGKIWLNAAELEVRVKDLPAARKLLGQAIGMCPKECLFKGYINLELQLGEIDRCRSIYAKYLEVMPYNCSAWNGFAQLEINVGEMNRARGIFEIAVCQSELDMPEMLWKAYIDFEISEREIERVRQLYERLLEKASHVKVWISYGRFESAEAVTAREELTSSDNLNEPADQLLLTVLRAREVFERGYAVLKEQELKEERLLLLEAWRAAEKDMSSFGGDVSAVDSKFPKKVKKRRMATNDEGLEVGWEEYYDYVFPDDEKKTGTMKLLEKAMQWKNQAASLGSGTLLGKRPSEPSAEIDIDDI